MNRALIQYIIDYKFSLYYHSETEWRRDFDKFKDDLAKARMEIGE